MTGLDLQAVDDLCRLAHAARRLGCRAHLVGVDSELRSMLELAGLADILCTCPGAEPTPDSSPTSGDLRCTP